MSVLAVAPRQTEVLPYRNSNVSAQQEVSLPQPSSDQVTLSSGDGKVGWGDAAVGLVGAVAGAAIETVGNTAGAVYHSAIGTAEAYRSLWKTEAIGPWLKGSIAMLIPVATVAVPVLTAIGSAGVGLYRGFTQGIQNGLGGAIEASVKDVKDFNSEVAVGARKSIREIADQKPEDGKEPFDISPVDGAKGFVAGIGNTVVGGVGIGVSTLSQIPEAFVTANRAIAKSDMGLPLKTVSHLVSVPLAAVAAPLGFVGGALFGLGSGAYYGYKEGFTEAFTKTGGHIKQYHKAVDDGLAKLAEGLVDG
jgi:hypothetical protein